MNRDDIIRMAREAHLVMYDYDHPSLERFFHMAQAAEREACAKLCLETEPFYGVMFAEAIRARGQA